jgi:hypothetical protein
VKKTYLYLLAGVVLLCPARLHAVPVTVLNPSFEFPAAPLATSCGPGCSFTAGSFTNWTVSGNAGVFHPDASRFTFPLPDGDQIAYGNGGTLSQTLSSTLLSSTTYTLTLAVGRRLDAAFPGYLVSLFAGATLLGSESSLSPLAGDFDISTVTFTSGPSHPLAGQPLRIQLSSTGTQTNFDAVQLDAETIPEPGTLLLLGSGVACLMGRGWRARRRPSARQ